MRAAGLRYRPQRRKDRIPVWIASRNRRGNREVAMLVHGIPGTPGRYRARPRLGQQLARVDLRRWGPRPGRICRSVSADGMGHAAAGPRDPLLRVLRGDQIEGRPCSKGGRSRAATKAPRRKKAVPSRSPPLDQIDDALRSRSRQGALHHSLSSYHLELSSDGGIDDSADAFLTSVKRAGRVGTLLNSGLTLLGRFPTGRQSLPAKHLARWPKRRSPLGRAGACANRGAKLVIRVRT